MDHFMNVKEANRFERFEIETEARLAAREGLLITVRCELYKDNDEWYERLSCINTMTPEEYESYSSNGGLWTYVPATEILAELR